MLEFSIIIAIGFTWVWLLFVTVKVMDHNDRLNVPQKKNIRKTVDTTVNTTPVKPVIALPKKRTYKHLTPAPVNGKADIAVRIYNLRKVRKLNRRELAEKVGVDQTTIFNWEARRTGISDDSLKSLCDALNVSPSYLRYGCDFGPGATKNA